MKKYVGLMIILVFVTILPGLAQEEKSEQLWYCWEEIVKPELVSDYFDLNKKLVEICKEENFKFTFHTFTSGDFKYRWYHPINSLGDIDEVEKEWDRIMEKFGSDNLATFQNTLLSHNSFTLTEKSELSFIPEEPRFSIDSIKYMRIQEFYVIPGREKEVEKVVHEANIFLKSKNYNDAWHMGIGEIGFNGPVFIGWSFATSMKDYLEQDEIFSEQFSDDFKEYNERFRNCLRQIVNKEAWYIRDLSFVNN